MPELTQDDVRQVVREEVAPLAKNMDTLLAKVDGFLKGLETEEHERVVADAQLERRIERLGA